MTTPKPIQFSAHRAALAVVLAVCLQSVSALADQPKVVETKISNLAADGDAGRITFDLEISNPNRSAILVEAPPFQSPLGYSVAVSPERLSLHASASASARVTASIARDGRYQLLVPLLVKDPRGNLLREVNVDVYFEVRGRRYTQSTYRELFIRPVAVERDDAGEKFKVFHTGAPPEGWADGPDFDEPHTEVEELERMSKSTLSKTDWRLSPTLPLPPPKGSFFHRDVPRFGGTVMAQDQNSVEAKGKLVYTGMDGQLHPCYGWRVVAYLMIGGQKAPLAITKVKGNGTWSMSFAPPLFFPVRIEYQPRNRFFELADPEDNTYYSFFSGVYYYVGPNDTINEFTQAVYTAGSDLINLGEVYRDGMRLWDALKTKGGGISPLRDESIIVYFPNTTYDCGTSQPWSCSHPAGFIWILPEHAANQTPGSSVMVHELSHQINREYWDNDSPSNGGSHSLTECTDDDPGLALVEGFADFMPFWVLFGPKPTADTPRTIETPPAGTCMTPNLNELWVAATFWDLYDAAEDGNDTMFFSNTGSVIGIYLLSGPQNTMAAYRTIYQFNALTSAAVIDAVFDQNNQ